jgi:hypothetical protein
MLAKTIPNTTQSACDVKLSVEDKARCVVAGCLQDRNPLDLIRGALWTQHKKTDKRESRVQFFHRWWSSWNSTQNTQPTSVRHDKTLKLGHGHAQNEGWWN